MDAAAKTARRGVCRVADDGVAGQRDCNSLNRDATAITNVRARQHLSLVIDDGVVREDDRSAAHDVNAAAVRRRAGDNVARDDVADERGLRIFELDTSPLRSLPQPIAAIVFDTVVLEAWCAALHPHATPQKETDIIGDDVVLDDCVAVIHPDTAAVVVRPGTGDREAV